MSPEAVFSLHNGFLLLICGLFSLIVPFGEAQQRNSKPEEFRCPEDFGYYPHPSDCSQYFVCVFGDPLLESCTGGLMYSHDLRTCDWPRNVGCGVTAAASSKNENNIGIVAGNVNSGGRHSQTTASWKQEVLESQPEEIPDRHLYEEEDIGPAEEVESDRQQRVYRGQPPTLGQVARDRDGIIRHANALQTSSGIEKVKPIAVVSFGSHHQSLSKGNSTNSLRFEPYTEDLDDLTKLETNRIKRDLTTRGENDDMQTSNDTLRGTGGYALRYRPLSTAETNSNDHTNTVYESANNANASTVQHSPSTTNILTINSVPNANSNRYTPSLIKLSTSGGRRPSHSVSKHRILTTTPRTQSSVAPANPTSAGSSFFHRYTDPSHSSSRPGHRYAYPIDDSPVATDYTIVNVVPKTQQKAANSLPLHHGVLSNAIASHPHYPQPQPSVLQHYTELSPYPHMPKPPPHSFPIRHVDHYPHPYYYSHNFMNNYVGPLAMPHFYPSPINRFNYYNDPEPSIVTLSYPQTEKTTAEHTNEASTTSPLTELTTKPTETTTAKDAAASTTDSSGHLADDKPSNASESKIQEVTQKKHKKPSDSSDENDDSDFNSDDEHGDDETEDVEQEDEEFEKIYFEEDDDGANETNVTSSLPEIKFSAKKKTTTTTTTTSRPGDLADNDELDIGYSFNENEVTTQKDKDKSEEDESADEPAEYEEPEEEEKDADDGEKESGAELAADNADETIEEVEIDDESTSQKGQDHVIKPAVSYYNRYVSDQHENPFTNPNFDFRAYLSDLTRPRKRRRHKTAENADASSAARTDTPRPVVGTPTKRKHKRSTDVDALQKAVASRRAERTVHARAAATNGTAQSAAAVAATAMTSKSAKMQRASARLVPLALIHTYKPANHSYAHNRLRIPSTQHFFDKPIDFRTSSYFDPNKFYAFGKLSDDRHRYTPPSSWLADKQDADNEECDSSSCAAHENDDEEDDTTANDERRNADTEAADEYYDDYAEEYTDEHLEQPLTNAVTPSVPSRLKNIDSEVFGEQPASPEEEEVQAADDDENDDGQNEGEREEEGNDNEDARNDDDADGEQADDGNDEAEQRKQKTDDGDDGDDAEDEYEDEGEGGGKRGEENANDEGDDEEEPNSHDENAETVSTSRKVKQPQPAPKQMDQLMTPYRPNKYLQNPLPSLSTYLLPPKPVTPSPPRTNVAAVRPSTYSPTLLSSRPTPAAFHRKPHENDKKIHQTQPTTTVRVQRPKANVDKKYSPTNPNLSLVFVPHPSHNLPHSNIVAHNPSIYNIPAHNPPYRIDQRNRNVTNGKSIDEDRNKNYAYYNTPNVNGIRVQMPSKSKRPLSSVPSYIVEDSLSSVPTTSKSVYNVTKIDPFYSVYDENPEIYRNPEIDHYHKQRKPPSDYQIIQDSHRLQPHSSQSLNNPTVYTNQDFRQQQSDIDGDSQQSDRLISSKLFVDSYSGASVRPPIDKSPFTYPFVPKLTNVSPPVVELQPPVLSQPSIRLQPPFEPQPSDTHINSRPTTLVTRNPPTAFQYESVKSEQLEYRTEDALVGETSHTPKLTSYVRKFTPTLPTTPTTPKLTRGTTLAKTNFILSTENFPSRDHFRIIVEPVSKNNGTHKSSTLVATTPTAIAFNVATNKLQLGDKFSSTFRFSNVPSQTLTPPSTPTTSTTATKPTNASPTDNDKPNNRRFYIPKTNPIERKLHFNYETTTNVPTIPRTDSLMSAKYTSPRPAVMDARADHTRTSSKAATGTVLGSGNGVNASTEKSQPSNELLYYDDGDEDDYEDVETAQNVDNYIDNKIVDYSSTSVRHHEANPTPKYATSQTYHNLHPSTTTNNHNGPKLFSASVTSAATTTTTTATHNPYDYVKTRFKEADFNTKRTIDRLKETTTDRCPQCNEKPSVRGRNRGSVTYSPGGNEYAEGATASAGRSRPTLKPSTSIVTKNTEVVDIYKHPPRRPDNVYPTPQADKVAAKCRKDICLLPDCSCGGKEIPGDLSPEETPQLVLLTFDDSVNELNRGLYVDLFEKGRVNPNGCPIAATFYVSHEWTDYSMVQNLYAAGHEIASHSVSHSFGEQFSQRKWTKEIVGQREILSAYGGVRQEDIRGMRAPFLAVGGNKMFKMLYDANFTYDSSMPIYENRPPSWPYTLDYKLFHDCMIPPCPTRSYPGVWEIPMVMWQDLNGGRCSMGDACSNPATADGVYKMLIKNFERHFSTNRAPFGLFYHSSWFTQPHHKEGFIAFLDTIVNMPEVWLVTNWQVIQWVRDPTPISRLNNFSPFNCDYPERPRRCNNAKVCNLWHKSGVRYLKTCQACPDVYPWTGKTGVRNSRIDIEEPPATAD